MFIAALMLALTSSAAPSRAVDDSASRARDIVAQFYAWYVPIAAKTPNAELRALRDTRWQFEPTLVTALRADLAASAKRRDEVVGLDMDPFLNSQDPCQDYAPTSVRRDGAGWMVDVLGKGGCEAHTTPDVTVRVEFKNANAEFVNFVYSQKANDDLKHVLAQLQATRAKRKSSRGGR